MKVATLEKFHVREGNQDPGDPGVGKVRGGKDGGGTDPGWHYENIMVNSIGYTQGHHQEKQDIKAEKLGSD